MAARSRPRGGQLKDEFDEERALWNQIRADARRIDQLMKTDFVTPSPYTPKELGTTAGFAHHVEPVPVTYTENESLWNQIRANAVQFSSWLKESDTTQKKILELEAEQIARKDRGEDPSNRIDSELEAALRENIKITNELVALIKSDDTSGNDVCSQLTLLSALRNADDAPPSSASRATSVGHNKSGRDRHGKSRKLTDSVDDHEADSPLQSSPKVVISNQKDRLMAKSGGSRAGSVPAAREASAKLEDDKDDLGKDLSKTRLLPSTEVLYRDPKKRTNTEGEGILCRVTSVIGEGKQRRYEIIDADPDPPTPSIPYRASVNHLVPIPAIVANTTLPDLAKGKNVLALYPGTTTFYKAEVVVGWRMDGTGKGEEGNLVRLRFEGEDEADREMSVERRYVLPDR